MKHTARPVTLNARNKQAKSPAKNTGDKTNTSTQSGSRTVQYGGQQYTEQTESKSGSGSGSGSAPAPDANAIKKIKINPAVSGGTAGDPYANQMRKLLASGNTVEEIVAPDPVTGKSHGTLEGMRKLLAPELAAQKKASDLAATKTKTTTESSGNSSSTTYTPKMGAATPERKGDKLYAWEVRNAERAGRIARRNEKNNANQGLREMEKMGVTTKGELNSNATDQQKTDHAAYIATKSGGGKGRRDRSQNSKNWMTGGNSTLRGNKFITQEKQKAKQLKATGNEDKVDNVNSHSESSSSNANSEARSSNANSEASTATGYNAAKNSKMASGSGIKPGVGGDYALDVKVSNPAQAPKASTAVSNKPTTLKDKRKFNKARKNEATMDAQSEVASAKMATSASAPSKGVNAVKTTNSTPDIKRSNMKIAKQEAARNVEAAKSAQFEKGITEKPILGAQSPKSSPYKMSRMHSSASPAKMWGNDGDVKEHSPAGQAKIDKATKSASDARWAKAKPASTPSPAKMWGPSKVKAGKGGFNRKK